MIWLLDGNVLVALRIDTHVHHDRAHRWFAALKKADRFATCVFTQGTLLRLHMKAAADSSAAAAWNALGEISAHPKHVWWDARMSFLKVPHRHLQDSTQVSDAWLAQLAREHKGRLATMDRTLALLYPEVALLLPL